MRSQYRVGAGGRIVDDEELRAGRESRGARSKEFAEPAVITGFHSVLSDDGQTAIVEFAARDRAAFQPILKRRAETPFVADPHLQSSDTLLQELRKFNAHFDLSGFLAGGL